MRALIKILILIGTRHMHSESRENMMKFYEVIYLCKNYYRHHNVNVKNQFRMHVIVAPVCTYIGTITYYYMRTLYIIRIPFRYLVQCLDVCVI